MKIVAIREDETILYQSESAMAEDLEPERRVTWNGRKISVSTMVGLIRNNGPLYKVGIRRNKNYTTVYNVAIVDEVVN